MKIAEIISEAGGSNMSRRGFIRNLLGTMASKGVNVSGVAKIVNQLAPDVFSILDKLAPWISKDRGKLYLFNDWVSGRGGGLTSPEHLSIKKSFETYFKNENPGADDNTVSSAFYHYMKGLKDQLGLYTPEYFNALRDLNGGALEIDSMLDVFKTYGKNAEYAIDLLKSSYKKDATIFEFFKNIQQLINVDAVSGIEAEIAAMALNTANTTIRQQLEKAKNAINNIANAPDDAKLTIEKQLEIVKSNVADMENVPADVQQTIEQKSQWIVNKLNDPAAVANDPDTAKAIKQQLEHIDLLVAQLTEKPSNTKNNT